MEYENTTKRKTSRPAKKSSGKKRIKIIYDAPFSITLSIILLVVMILIKQMPKEFGAFFTAPGCQGSAAAFNWKNLSHYARLFFHIFGHKSWSSLTLNISFILLLGPSLEEKFGSKLLAVMTLTAAFISGVINASFIPSVLYGAGSVVFMMILLTAYTAINKDKLSFAFIMLFAVFLMNGFLTSGETAESAVSVIAHIAGGLSGSIFGFVAAKSS